MKATHGKRKGDIVETNTPNTMGQNETMAKRKGEAERETHTYTSTTPPPT